MLIKCAILAAVALILWFELLKPDLKPTSPDDKRGWFKRAYDSITGAWSNHGSVWKRNVTFLAGFAFCVFVQWVLSLAL